MPHTTPPSVLHLLAPATFGGLESVVTTLARGQIDAGQRVNVAAFIEPGRTDHPFVETLRAAGVPARAFPTPTRAYLAERRIVRDLILELRPDVLHTHGYRPDVVDSGVARRMGLGTVSTVHGFAATGRKGKTYEWVQLRWFRRFGAVVVVSAALRRQLLASGVDERRLHLIQNAWQPTVEPHGRSEARSALGLDPDAPVVGWVGRLSGEKGPEVMIEGLAACARRDVQLSFIGRGSREAEVRALAADRGVADRVHWHGFVPDAGRYLPAFDALLMTSWTEGTPIVLLEAMGAGVPVVTTAVGGVPEVVSDREALLVPAGDAAAVARGIGRVLDDPKEARGRAEAARRRLARDFAVMPWVERYRKVYASCIRKA
jgi:glycosyltransferase involved in cell wall biosynthesis